MGRLSYAGGFIRLETINQKGLQSPPCCLNVDLDFISWVGGVANPMYFGRP